MSEANGTSPATMTRMWKKRSGFKYSTKKALECSKLVKDMNYHRIRSSIDYMLLHYKHWQATLSIGRWYLSFPIPFYKRRQRTLTAMVWLKIGLRYQRTLIPSHLLPYLLSHTTSPSLALLHLLSFLFFCFPHLLLLPLTLLIRFLF